MGQPSEVSRGTPDSAERHVGGLTDPEPGVGVSGGVSDCRGPAVGGQGGDPCSYYSPAGASWPRRGALRGTPAGPSAGRVGVDRCAEGDLGGREPAAPGQRVEGAFRQKPPRRAAPPPKTRRRPRSPRPSEQPLEFEADGGHGQPRGELAHGRGQAQLPGLVVGWIRRGPSHAGAAQGGWIGSRLWSRATSSSASPTSSKRAHCPGHCPPSATGAAGWC
jgi:hypothetical protein